MVVECRGIHIVMEVSCTTPSLLILAAVGCKNEQLGRASNGEADWGAT